MSTARSAPRLSRGSRVLLVAGWTAAVALSGLIVAATLPYYDGGLDHAFLVEKGPLAREPLWRAAFYLHITGAMACLATGPLLFWPWLRRRSLAAHRLLGRTYVLAVLVWAAPVGLVLSLHAKGGAWGRSCFMILSLGWLLTTAAGLVAVHRRQLRAHAEWMIRSFSLALSAVTFRAFQLVLAAGGVADEPNYIASLWLSLGASLVLAEAWIRARPGRRSAATGAATRLVST